MLRPMNASVSEHVEASVPLIRNAEDGDIDAITRIYNQAVLRGGSSADLTARSVEQRRAWVQAHAPRDRYPVVVMEYDGMVVGFGSLSAFHERAGYDGVAELSYYLDERWRGRGWGQRMAQWLVHAAVQRGFSHATAIVFDDNEASKAVLRHLGFTCFGVLPQAVRSGDGKVRDMGYWYRTLAG